MQVNFRMPASLKARLEREARDNGRSLTAEIVHRLMTTLEAQPLMTAAEVQERIFTARPTADDVERAPSPHDLLMYELQQAVSAAIERRMAELTHEGLTATFFDTHVEDNPATFYKPPKGSRPSED